MISYDASLWCQQSFGLNPKLFDFAEQEVDGYCDVTKYICSQAYLYSQAYSQISESGIVAFKPVFQNISRSTNGFVCRIR